jgi:hypothetical protein
LPKGAKYKMERKVLKGKARWKLKSLGGPSKEPHHEEVGIVWR